MVPLLTSVAFAQPPPRDAMATALDQQRATATRQRQAIQRQAESLGVRLAPMGVETPPADAKDAPDAKAAADTRTAADPSCDAISADAATSLIETAAKAQDLEPRLLRAIIEQESGLHPCAVSPRGAKGLMQLMPDTAQDLGVADPFDPRQSIDAGAKYFRQLMTRYNGDLKRALGAYNAGPTTVDQAGGVPDIAETRQYVESILRKLDAGKPVSK